MELLRAECALQKEQNVRRDGDLPMAEEARWGLSEVAALKPRPTWKDQSKSMKN